MESVRVGTLELEGMVQSARSWDEDEMSQNERHELRNAFEVPRITIGPTTWPTFVAPVSNDQLHCSYHITASRTVDSVRILAIRAMCVQKSSEQFANLNIRSYAPNIQRHLERQCSTTDKGDVESFLVALNSHFRLGVDCRCASVSSTPSWVEKALE